MKQILFFLFITCNLLAQKPCELAENITDSIGTYKATNEFLMHERIFADSEDYLFLSLINDNGTPALNLKTIQKSNDFVKANCLNKSTKIIFQLSNGKFITLVHNGIENCGTYNRNPDDGKNSRFNSGLFLFLTGSMEELKNTPIILMRIQYATEAKDYVMAKEFTSEFTKKVSYPETFFVDNLHCIM